jgi:hypothetical protein
MIAISSKSPGIYLVIQDKKELVSIGSYRRGVLERWCKTREKLIKHFKRMRIAELLRKKKKLRVFAQDEITIKKQLSHSTLQWVNCTGIEPVLISKYDPPWNTRGRSREK